MTFCTFLEQLKKVKLLRKGPGGKAPNRWAILAIFQKKSRLDDVLNVFRAIRKS